MAANTTTTRRNVQGASLGKAPSDSDVVQLTKADLNALIASAVSAAVNASSNIKSNAPVSQDVNDRFSGPRVRLEQDFNERMRINNRFAQQVDNEPTEYFSIPKIYEKYIGSVVASVNGQTIKIPVDGVKRRIPVRYIPVIMAYVENIDRKVATMNETAADQYGGVAEIKGGAF